MISDALNESDRLASCSKRIRKNMKQVDGSFNVYALQTASNSDTAENPDDFLLSYNVNGIRMSEAAFRQLRQEISRRPAGWNCLHYGAARNLVCMLDWCRWAGIFSVRSWYGPAGLRKSIRENLV